MENLILRGQKGSNLTAAEVDGNFTKVKTAVDAAEQALGTAIPAIQPEAADYRARILAAGGAIDAAALSALDEWVVTGKRDGWLSKFVYYQRPLGNSLAAAMVPLIAAAGRPVATTTLTESDYSQALGFDISSNTDRHVNLNFSPAQLGLTNSDFAILYQRGPAYYDEGSSYVVGTDTPDGAGKDANPRIGRDVLVGGMGEEIFYPHDSIVYSIGNSSYGVINGLLTNEINEVRNNDLDVTQAMYLFRTQRQNDQTYYAKGSLSAFGLLHNLTKEQALSLAAAELRLDQAIRQYRQAPVIVFLGDSNTAGGSVYELGSTRSPKTYADAVARRLNMRLLNLGSGTAEFLNYSGVKRPIYERGVDLVRTYAPRALVVVAGTNDINNRDGQANGDDSMVSDYQNKLTDLLSRAQQQNVNAVASSPLYGTVHSATKYLKYVNAAAVAAKTQRVPFVDAWNLFADEPTPANFFNDNPHIHINVAGHQRLADAVYAALVKRQLQRRPLLDFPSVAAGSSQTLTTTVLNAEVGMTAAVAALTPLAAGLLVSAVVTANDTVSVTLTNVSGSAIDPAPAQYAVQVQVNY